MTRSSDARWTEAELRAAVEVYALLWRAERESRALSSRGVIDAAVAGPLAARNAGAVRMRMSNIASVVAAAGKPLLTGFRPLTHISAAEASRLHLMLAAEGIV